MVSFEILKQSTKSRARMGILKTSYGEVETPLLVPVATQAVVKTLTSEEVTETKTQMLIANTFHLHLKPGETIVKQTGGLHSFMNWPKPIMTDSGGFQVFSLGFGKDYNTSKIIKQKLNETITEKQQPRLLNITDDGVLFTSYLDGKKLFLGPTESTKIQQALGADITFAFDECPPPMANYDYVKRSLVKTHRWANICLKTRTSKQALFGIIQGGKYRDLRIESAQFIRSLPFDGFGIGGEFGYEKQSMAAMLQWIVSELPDNKPRHLLGVGYPEDIVPIIQAGVDTFDCIVPTHFARHGIAFTAKGRLDLQRSIYLKDKNPLDKACTCFVCQNYRRAYISHLFRAKEITAMRLVSFHNLYFFNSYIQKIRENIKNGIR